jgi:hypothetical protein
MTAMENQLVKAFNDHFQASGTPGIAFRLKQYRYSRQWVDVLVDSKGPPPLRLGIECKSLKADAKALYFTQHFHRGDGPRDQVSDISDFLRLSGREGWLAVELRAPAGQSNRLYLIPWGEVEKRASNGSPGFTVAEITTFRQVPRKGRLYQLDARLLH